MLSMKKLWAQVRSALQYRVESWYVTLSGWRDDVPELDEDGKPNWQYAKIHVRLEYDIWYWRFLHWLCWDCGLVLCHWYCGLQWPKFVRNWKRAWDEDEPNEIITFEEWYGPDVCTIWHLYVEDPILQFIWRHQSPYGVEFDMTLDEARKKFEHWPEKLEWIWKSIEEHKQWDAEKAAQEAANELKAE